MVNHDRVAVITGGSSGIGAASARALAKDGWSVVVCARRVDKLESVARETGGYAQELDVTDQASVDRCAQEIERLYGRVDLLVNNAGGAKGLDRLDEAVIEDWQWMFDTNVLGTVRVTKALLPLVKAAPDGTGQIIMMSSIAGHTPYVGGSGYNAAKHGVAALTRALRLELLGEVRVVEICPGRVATDFSTIRFKGDVRKAAEVYAGHMNLVAEDIAEAVRWIASLPAHMNVDSITIKPKDQA